MRTLSGLGTLPIVAFFWVGKMGPTPLDHLDRPWRCWATMLTCPPFSKKQIWIRTVQNQDVELGGNQEEPMLLRKHGKDVGFCPLNVQPVCSKKAPWCFERFGEKLSSRIDIPGCSEYPKVDLGHQFHFKSSWLFSFQQRHLEFSNCSGYFHLLHHCNKDTHCTMTTSLQ